MNIDRMSSFELKILFSICAIFSLRIFGMYIVLPVLSTYGTNLKDSNMTLIGLAIGIYGFFQVLFQLPYGWLSDKFGRKQVIILGLLFFLIGSIISWNAQSIWSIIIGRGLQGSGAISSVCMAFLSDHINSRNRIKAMGFLGACFGFSFIISIIISPMLAKLFSFNFLFGVSTVLALLCLVIAVFFIPFTVINVYKCINFKNETKNLLSILKDNNLFKLNINVFIVHFLLMCNFIAIPFQLKLLIDINSLSWMLYLIFFLLSFFIVFPTIYFFRTNTCIRNILSISKVLLLISNCIFLIFVKQYILLILGFQLFFVAFSFFEIILPTLVSKQSILGYKGTTMAIYSMSQFLGSFLGGCFIGLILDYFNSFFVFLFQFFITLFWCWNDIIIRVHKKNNI